MERQKYKGLRPWLKNVLALLLGILLALILLEALIRIFEPIEFRVRGTKLQLPVNRKWVVRDHNIRGIDKVIYHNTNWLGFRGENPPRYFADYLTIIAVGGSTTNCRYISEGKTWIDLLGEKLKKSFPKLWINNAGCDGQTTFGHLILMQDIIVHLNPKVVLFLVGANDQRLESSKIHDTLFLRKKKKHSIYGFIRRSLEHSEIYYYLVNFYRYYRARKMGMLHFPVDLTKSSRREVPEKQAKDAKEEHRKKYLRGYETRLTRLIEISREHGIEPVFITQPYLLGAGMDDVTGVNLAKVAVNSLNGKVTWEILELYNNVVQRVGKEHQVLVIDLGREMPKSSKYFYDYYHFTNDGSVEVADIIFRHVEPFLKKKFAFWLDKSQ